MEQRKTYLVRIDRKTWRRIAAMAKSRGTTRISVVRDAVANAFASPDPTSNVGDETIAGQRNVVAQSVRARA